MRTGGTNAPLSRYSIKDEINERLASYIGVEHEQQVTTKWICHKKNLWAINQLLPIHIQFLV